MTLYKLWVLWTHGKFHQMCLSRLPEDYLEDLLSNRSMEYDQRLGQKKHEITVPRVYGGSYRLPRT